MSDSTIRVIHCRALVADGSQRVEHRPRQRKAGCHTPAALVSATRLAREVTLQEVGWAMINAVIKGYPQPILEVKDIVQLARV
jgi:hypothetical protein